MGLVSVVVIGVVAYVPAVDNFFISDDFTLLSYVTALDQSPTYILSAPSEFFRLVSYIYFWSCFKIFGLNPQPYYWMSIVLHVVVSLLVYQLVKTITHKPLAAWGAAVFFAAYERHQEAVMWISATNETILTLGCLVFLIIWEYQVPHEVGLKNVTLPLLVFIVTLFSKEAAVILAPMAITSLVLRGYTWREILRTTFPLILTLALFIALWLFRANQNFFITDGHYALGLHFVPVYVRSLFRLLTQLAPILVAFLIFGSGKTRSLLSSSSVVYFAIFVTLSVAPYCFLTYLNQIPSRNTYFPSVGLAALTGILFAGLYEEMSSLRARSLCAGLLMGVVAGNLAYLWLRKEPQYRERAVPTLALIDVLNKLESSPTATPILVCGFPLHPWIGREAVGHFTRVTRDQVVFSETCEPIAGATVLSWDGVDQKYLTSAP
jgi:hypothetical protein